MKFLLDQNQSPLLADLLNAAGHDAIHTRDIGLSRAPDVDVLTRATPGPVNPGETVGFGN